MIRRLFLAILLLLTTLSYGQQSDYTICDCCTYSMFQYKNDYNTVFSPEIIKASGFKELTIYTTSKRASSTKDSVFNLVDKQYTEMIFRFNSNGYVKEQIIFNRRGQYHSVYEFTRDENNKVLTKTFQYLNESGNKVDDFLPEKWVYVYADGQLAKIKKLGEKLTEQPDNESDYSLYKYDSKGRIVSETRQLYYDWTEPSYYQTLTKYNDTIFNSTATTRDQKKCSSQLLNLTIQLIISCSTRNSMMAEATSYLKKRYLLITLPDS